MLRYDVVWRECNRFHVIRAHIVRRKKPFCRDANAEMRVEHPRLVASVNYRLCCTKTKRQNENTRLRVFNDERFSHFTLVGNGKTWRQYPGISLTPRSRLVYHAFDDSPVRFRIMFRTANNIGLQRQTRDGLRISIGCVR